jgi:hypothetical protein
MVDEKGILTLPQIQAHCLKFTPYLDIIEIKVQPHHYGQWVTVKTSPFLA